MDRKDKEHAILNAWIDDGIDNGVFFSMSEVTKFSADLSYKTDEALQTLFEFWVNSRWHISNGYTRKEPIKSCTCGAKHTSNPKFHLSYCEMNHE